MLSLLLLRQRGLETQSPRQEEARFLVVEGPRLPWPHSTAPQSCPRGRLTPAREAITVCTLRPLQPAWGWSALLVAGHQGPRQVHGQGRLVRVLAEVPPGTPSLLEAAGGAFDPEKPRACNPGAAGAPA